MYFVYSRHLTQLAALDALGDYFADGEVFESELYHTGIKKIGTRWCVVLRS